MNDVMVDGAAPPVVIGAGIGGLAAAAALRMRFGDVVVVERDSASAAPGTRPGVPHSAQLHNLLGRAQLSLERLAPGYCDALVKAGGCRARVSQQTHVHEHGVRMPERDLGWDLISAPRMLVEQVLRELVLIHRGISFVNGRAVGLCREGDRVSGVVVATESGTTTLNAPIVVDAAGASSHAAEWLQAGGWNAPRTEESKATHWYVTAKFRRPPAWHGRDDFWLVFPTYPGTRSALLSPAADAQWVASVVGAAGDVPPKSPREVIAYASSLDDPTIGDLLSEAEPLGRPTLFRKSIAMWRRYDELGRVPTGFLPIGDALANFDPLFGQGISLATWQAAELARLAETADSIHGLTAAYVDAASAACRRAWNLGRAVENRSTEVAAAIASDPETHRAYVADWHLLDPAPVGAGAGPSDMRGTGC